MRNIKARYLWIMVVALFLIAIGLIVGCSYASGTLNTILIVFLAIDFISLTIVIQAASFKTFKYKPRTKKLPTKEYHSDIDLRGLADKGFSYTEREYGYTAIKIVGRNAYKITVVEDSNLYYHPTKEENGKPNKALDKCNKMVGFEIFTNPTDEDYKRLPDFTIEADKIYYTAFIKEDSSYKCLNYLEPTEAHLENYNSLIEELGFVEKIENNEE